MDACHASYAYFILERNYGHGKEHLSTVLCLLMMLAFLIDQIQEMACSLFQEVKRVVRAYRSLWERMRVIFQYITVGCWQKIYLLIARKQRFFDTS